MLFKEIVDVHCKNHRKAKRKRRLGDQDVGERIILKRILDGMGWIDQDWIDQDQDTDHGGLL
jgi:hypothetical protein